MLKKLLVILLLACLIGCQNKQQATTPPVGQTEPVVTTTTTTVVTTTPKVTTTTTTIPVVEEVPININDYAFASLPFIQSNIKDGSIYTAEAEEYPKVIVQDKYCKLQTERILYEGYIGCNLVYNAMYETFGNYQTYLFSNKQYEAKLNANTPGGKIFQINGEDLLNIIEKSTNIIEMPTTIFVAFNSIFDNTGYWINLEEDETHYSFQVFDTYFVLEIKNFDDSSSNYVKSYTYFENDELKKYIDEVWE